MTKPAGLQAPTVLSHCRICRIHLWPPETTQHHPLHPHTSCNFNFHSSRSQESTPEPACGPGCNGQLHRGQTLPQRSRMRARITENTDNTHPRPDSPYCSGMAAATPAGRQPTSGGNCPAGLVLNLSWLASASSRDLKQSVCTFSFAVFAARRGKKEKRALALHRIARRGSLSILAV